jgi:hypothetical protein
MKTFILTAFLFVGCSQSSDLFNKFANANSPEEEVQYAEKLNKAKLQYSFQLLDANGAVLPQSAVQKPADIVYVELEFEGKKFKRRLTHTNTLEWITGE